MSRQLEVLILTEGNLLKVFVAVTDFEWYKLLAQLPGLDEVNFWQPGGSNLFKALQPGEPLLFKLHYPRNFVVGGGYFVHATRLPVALAWETFGVKNGVNSLAELISRISRYRRGVAIHPEKYEIGCVILTEPFFLEESAWISAPPDWSRSIVVGKTYSLSQGYGKTIWEQILGRLGDRAKIAAPTSEKPRYGKPIEMLPRLGQGAFRVLVTDSYQRRCALTGERVLPVLEAAHIKPYAENGPHDVSNGLLLRSDLHRLFDQGYLTIDDSYKVNVSRKIREQFHNGQEYYQLLGQQIRLPSAESERPAFEFLQWHQEHRFLG